MRRMLGVFRAIFLTVLLVFTMVFHPALSRPAWAEGSFDASQCSVNSNLNNLEYNAFCAYIYGYPLLLMDFTKSRMTTSDGTSGAGELPAMPPNQFTHTRLFPTPTSTVVVRPNNDTLYSLAWLDLSSEPQILTLPAMPKIDDHDGNPNNDPTRYYVMPMLDGWTNVFESISNRNSITNGGNFMIAGPNWNSHSQPLPSGVELVSAPTNMAWIIGRTQTNGVDDYNAVHALQNQYKLTPLSAWGTDYHPSQHLISTNFDRTTPPPTLVANLSGIEFFKNLATLMRDNPPAQSDTVLVSRLETLNIIPGQELDVNSLTDAQMNALTAAPQPALNAIIDYKAGQSMNHWKVSTNLGNYGTNYLLRAETARDGLGANLPEDAIYPSDNFDSQGDSLDASKHNYRLHFDQNNFPPSNPNAFWSLTLYDADGFFVNNDLCRYSIGSRNLIADSDTCSSATQSEPMQLNADGSLDIYIQASAPQGHESNWLPAPNGEFNLMLRMYWPNLDGQNNLFNTDTQQVWQPPAVEIS